MNVDRTPLLRTAAAIALLAIGLAVASRIARSTPFHWPWSASPPRVSHEIVATQLQNVAKLVSTELTLRDVVTYEQSRFGMHRRALLVVTGKVMAGIDMKKNVTVKIDDRAKRISIELPRAEILAVEVLDSRTYDERAGLFFSFEPEDRDAIQRQTRTQLRTTGESSGLLPQADRSARELLQSLLAKDGYTVEVTTRTQLSKPTQ